MGGASVALGDLESAFYNVSALAWQSQRGVAVALQAPYALEGFSYKWAALAMPVATGSWAASYVHYGGEEYSEQQVSLAYALPVSQRLAAGAALHYLYSGTSDPHYRPQHLLTFSLAMQYRQSDALSVGFRAYSPVSMSLTAAAEEFRVPAVFNLGVAWHPVADLLAIAELEEVAGNRPRLRCGLEYRFLDFLYARAGLATGPAVWCFGAGLHRPVWALDLGAQWHTALGLTPHLSLCYLF